jgi:thermostable 8-oxoguanine DNA glycosylase
MVDPENITEFNCSKARLEELILFWVSAAGKNGRVAARNLDCLLEGLQAKKVGGPFFAIRRAKNLPYLMKECGIGCYNHKARTFMELATSNLNLKTCTSEDLESIYGIGRKTSRCFIMHSRRDARYAGLDTHMLKYLKLRGIENVPKSTPSSKKEYERLEREVLRLADVYSMMPADFDLMVWNFYSKGKKL